MLNQWGEVGLSGAEGQIIPLAPGMAALKRPMTEEVCCPEQGSWPKHCATLSYTMYVGTVPTLFGNSVREASPRAAHAERWCAGGCSLTRGNLAVRHTDCARLVD